VLSLGGTLLTDVLCSSQEIAEYMGLKTLRARLTDESQSMSFEGLFPKDAPKNSRFAINFWTAIGLGGVLWIVHIDKFTRQYTPYL